MSNSTGILEWEGTIKAVQITNILLTVTCTWILISSIFWGTKDGRWIRNPAKSGFNSGIVFVTYVVTMAALLVVIVLSMIQLNISADGTDSRLCKVILESTSVLGYLVSYGTYVFVWIQQRRIFLHPCVRNQVTRTVKALNIIFLASCTITAVTLLAWHFINPVGMYGAYDCFDNKSGSMAFTIGTTTATCLVHILMLSLSLYPAFQENSQTNPSGSPEVQPQDDATESTCFATFYRNIKLSKKMMKSPINLTIRRVVCGTFIIFLSDLCGGIATLVTPSYAPNGVRRLPQNISDLVGAIGMLVMLGFLGKVLTFFVPIRAVHIQRVAQKTRSVRRTTKHAPVPA